MFFDDFPSFYETSHTAATARRLNLRHHAMIEANRDILESARVLDLASHDGRWSFAALKAGAKHVIGVEARHELVDNANKTFAEYGVDPNTYEFVRGDMFRVLRTRDFEVDVVLCFGFIYHTLRYPELFGGILDAGPRHVVLDTKVLLGDEPVVGLLVNRTGVQSNAAADRFSHRRKVVAGWPSLPALRLMLDTYDMEVEQEFDWPALLASNPDFQSVGGDYRDGYRVTLRCRTRPEGLPDSRQSRKANPVPVPATAGRRWRLAGGAKVLAPAGRSRSPRMLRALAAAQGDPGAPRGRRPR